MEVMKLLNRVIILAALFFFFTGSSGYAQKQESGTATGHYRTVPIANTGNLIELILDNSTAQDIKDITVTVEGGPRIVKQQKMMLIR
jgi:hypothetical protein